MSAQYRQPEWLYSVQETFSAALEVETWIIKPKQARKTSTLPVLVLTVLFRYGANSFILIFNILPWFVSITAFQIDSNCGDYRRVHISAWNILERFKAVLLKVWKQAWRAYNNTSSWFNHQTSHCTHQKFVCRPASRIVPKSHPFRISCVALHFPDRAYSSYSILVRDPSTVSPRQVVFLDRHFF